MARTFICGIGMVVVVAEDEAAAVRDALEKSGEAVNRIGTIEKGKRGCTVEGPAGCWGADEDWSATHEA
jgi:phosphoribosylformylglycinamidine cyclo-ligase